MYGCVVVVSYSSSWESHFDRERNFSNDLLCGFPKEDGYHLCGGVLSSLSTHVYTFLVCGS